MNKIVILGGGESGVGSAILAHTKGFEVFLSDKGIIAEKYVEMLNSYGIEFEMGAHTLEKIVDANLCVKSPGIPEKNELIKKMREIGIPIISEIEFAGRYCEAKIIAITGSNGKTTTTTLTHKILSEAGYNVGLAGNIGSSFALQVATTDRDWYVLELSSFQLDGMFDFKCDVAILTNITPDHLDRYEYKLDNYANSKLRIVQNMGKGDTFIYSMDDPETKERILRHAESFNMDSAPFSINETLLYGASLGNEGTVDINIGQQEMVLELSKIKLVGRHNLYNIMASSLAALSVGVEPEKVVESVYSFEGVEHRMEPVCEKDGILYINDSKATNVDSVYYALDGIDRPAVWIAGGTDKGNDYSPLFELAHQKVRTLICMGVDNSKLIDSFTGVVPFIYSTATFEDAMEKVRVVSKSGDCVLLSPACASFDLFKNYEHRGECFKKAVLELTPKHREQNS